MNKSPSYFFREWLDKQISESAPNFRIPTARVLSATFGLSEKSVKAIFREYQKKGTLSCVRGKGTFLNPCAPEDCELQSRLESSAAALALRVEELLNDGSVRIGEVLPQVKLLSMQFKVTGSTVIEAYRILEKKGRVVKVGRNYWAGTLKEIIYSRPGKDVWFFYDSEDDLETAFSSGELAKAYLYMQSELLRRGFGLRYAPVDHLKKKFGAWLREERFPSGLIFHRVGLHRYEEYSDDLAACMASRKRLRVLEPMRVLFDWVRTSQTISFPSFAHNLLRGHVSTAVAKTFAEFFVQQKCSEATYFTAIDDLALHMGFDILSLKLAIEARELSPGFRMKFMLIPPRVSPDSDIKLNAEDLRMHKREWAWKHHAFSVDEIGQEDVRAEKNLEDCLRNAVQSAVWIFSKDCDALSAIKWAERNRIKIPIEKSVISMENNPRYLPHGISACVPDWENIGYAMAHALIGDFPVKKTRRGFVATQAHLLYRMTTPGR